MPMNEIIVRFDKMMGGNKKMEKREMQVRDSTPSLEEATPTPNPNPSPNPDPNQVRDSIPILEEAEAEKMISEEEIKRRALHAVEQEGTPSNPKTNPNPNPDPKNPNPNPNPKPDPTPHPPPRQEGIVFIDEIDKICSRGDFRGSADASSEGVQRDLLPLLEGSVVSTKQARHGLQG